MVYFNLPILQRQCPYNVVVVEAQRAYTSTQAIQYHVCITHIHNIVVIIISCLIFFYLVTPSTQKDALNRWGFLLEEFGFFLYTLPSATKFLTVIFTNIGNSHSLLTMY